MGRLLWLIAELVAEVAVMVMVVPAGSRIAGAVYVVEPPLEVVAGLKVPQGEPAGVVVQDHTTPPFALSLFTEATSVTTPLTGRLVGTVFKVRVIGGLEPLLHPASAAIVARAVRNRIDLRNVIG